MLDDPVTSQSGGSGELGADHSPAWPLFLGCPVWNCAHWAGEVYPARTPKHQWLSWYTRIFNSVEGNSTFYGLPKQETAKRWASESAPGFRFCFKFPQAISHDRELVAADWETQEFLAFLEPFAEADRLGSSFLQLGPYFGPDRFDVLRRYLTSLPTEMKWAVELRHHDWFDSGVNERRVNELLGELGMDKVLFDSRPLYQAPPDDPIEQASQRRKPKTPVRQTVTAKHPMLRLVGRNRVELTDRFLDQWVPIVTGWIDGGLRPYVFMHAPDDTVAPQLARRFADRLQAALDSKKTQLRESGLPRHCERSSGQDSWWNSGVNNEKLTVRYPPRPRRQLSLFDDLGPSANTEGDNR